MLGSLIRKSNYIEIRKRMGFCIDTDFHWKKFGVYTNHEIIVSN